MTTIEFTENLVPTYTDGVRLDDIEWLARFLDARRDRFTADDGDQNIEIALDHLPDFDGFDNPYDLGDRLAG